MSEVSGYGYEWKTELFGGPLDGLKGSVIAVNETQPPARCVERLKKPKTDKKLGMKILEHWGQRNWPDEEKIAVYELAEPDRYYNDEEDVCSYQFIESMCFGDYKKKYA